MSHYFIYLCIWMGSFFIMPQFLHAAHLIGGEIYYEYVGEPTPGVNRYLITLKVYRDCRPGANGANFDNPGGLSIGRSDFSYFMRNFDISSPSIKSLTNEFSNECLVLPPNLCVQEAVYTRTVDLPLDTLRSYYIIYQRCCRNNTIFNIISPEQYGATYYVEITPQAQKLKSSSPKFKNFPPIAICANYALNFDHSAEDVDGDSLVYTFAAPLHGGGQDLGNGCSSVMPTPDCLPPYNTVEFRSPFTSTSPMGGNPVVKIDPLTGELSGTPTTLGQYVVGVRVDEYRNGVKISSILRDFQFNVSNCHNIINANIASRDLEGKNIDFKLCGDSVLHIKNKSTQEQSIFNYNWIIKSDTGDVIITTKDLSYDIKASGIYEGIMILNNGLQCTDTAFFNVERFPKITADFAFDYDTCHHAGITFDNLSYSEDNLSFQSKWFADNNEISLNDDHLWKPESPDYVDIQLVINDINNCSDSLTTRIPYFPIPKLALGLEELVGCEPMEVTFPLLSPLLNDTLFKVVWDFGNGKQSNVLSPDVVYEKEGVYDVSFHAENIFGCVYDTTFQNIVRVGGLPTAGFDYNPKEVSNIKPNIQITDISSQSVAWSYDFGNGDILNIQNPKYTYPDTGIYQIKQIVTHKSGCTDSTYLLIDVTPIYTLYLPNAFRTGSIGDNTFFRPVGNGFGLYVYSMSIYDRWGNRVFYTEDWEQGWDGKDKNGRFMPNGNYAVKVHVVGPRGKEETLLGSALLIR